MPITVRKAETKDIEWMLGELEIFSKFFGTKKELYSEKNKGYLSSFLTKLIQDHVFFIAEKDRDPMGFISGFYSHHVYNPEILTLTEAAWWVKEKYRGSRAGLSLFNQFASEGEKNADWITFTIEDHSPLSDRFLLRRGFIPKEKSYLKECQ